MLDVSPAGALTDALQQPTPSPDDAPVATSPTDIALVTTAAHFGVAQSCQEADKVPLSIRAGMGPQASTPPTPAADAIGMPAVPANSSAPASVPEHVTSPPAVAMPATATLSTTQRALIYLALCIGFAAALLTSMLLGGTTATTAAPCVEGATISQLVAVPVAPDVPPHLLAVVRPPAFPNVAPGNEPGCDALYRSDDNGLTWTAAFSATAEAPEAVAAVPGSSRVYLLTRRLGFPLYDAGNIYRSDNVGAAWTWTRVSPQGRHAVPYISAASMLLGSDGTVLAREGNGDGGALVRSVDGGVSWQALAIPELSSVASVATLGPLIAVTPPLYSPGRPPGLFSVDGGWTWQTLGVLPGAPQKAGLRPTLSTDPVARALILELAPSAAVGLGSVTARYRSLNGGRTWVRVTCGARPVPGCAPLARWAQVGGTRYVLYHHRIFRALFGRAWAPLPGALPAPSADVLSLLAVSGRIGDILYLVTPTAIWRLEDGRWLFSASGLVLSGPTPVEG